MVSLAAGAAGVAGLGAAAGTVGLAASGAVVAGAGGAAGAVATGVGAAGIGGVGGVSLLADGVSRALVFPGQVGDFGRQDVFGAGDEGGARRGGLGAADRRRAAGGDRRRGRQRPAPGGGLLRIGEQQIAFEAELDCEDRRDEGNMPAMPAISQRTVCTAESGRGRL